MLPKRGKDSLRANIVANGFGQVVALLVALVILPVYVRNVGLAGYGLIAILASLSSALTFFTRGLGWSLRQQLGRVEQDSAPRSSKARRLTRSFELAYLVIGLGLGGSIAGVSGVVAPRFATDGLTVATIQFAIVCVGLRIAVAFPASVYQAVFAGLGRQVLGNVLTSATLIFGAVAGGGAAIVTHDLRAIFAAELAVSAVSSVILRFAAIRVVGSRQPGERRFLERREIAAIAPLSGGLIWANGAGMIIKQADRLVVGAVLSLSSVGAYSAAASVGGLLSAVYSPFLTAVFPHTCALAARKPEEVPRHVAETGRVVAVLACGVAVPLAWFSNEVLLVWTNDASLASAGAKVMSLALVAGIFLGLADALNQANTALGTSRCSAVFNSAALVLLPALLLVGVDRYGIVGAALAWLGYCAAAFMTFFTYTFHRLGPRTGRGYLRTVLPVVLGIVVLDSGWAAAVRTVVDAPWARLIAAGTGATLLLVGTLLALNRGRAKDPGDSSSSD